MLGKVSEVAVTEDAEGTPASLTKQRERLRVVRVYDHRRIADAWWADEVRRDYFRLELSNGSVCEIYHDMIADRWYLTRGYG
jgi:hypothetical protein